MSKRDAGQALLTTFIGSLPAELQTAAKDLFSKPEAATALDVLGESAMMRSDYSRAQDALRQETERLTQWHGELKSWFEPRQSLVALGEAAQKAGWSPESDPSVPPGPRGGDLPADVLRKADFEKAITEREVGVANFIAAVTPLAVKHYQTFGEVLDVQALLADPKVREIGILGVYEAKHADRLAEKAKAAEDARINTIVTERLAEERKKLGDPRFPTSRATEESPLAALSRAQAEKNGTAGADPADLADMYTDLVAKSQAAAG